MPVQIVDVLEAVEVDEQESHARVCGLGYRENALDPLPEANTVEKPSEPVVVRPERERVHELPVLYCGGRERSNPGELCEQVARGL